MINEVARLKALAGRRQAITERQHETGNPNHALLERLEIERDILDAIPKLLDIMGQAQKGDAERLEYAVRYLESTNCPAQCIEAVSRMLELARLVEATE